MPRSSTGTAACPFRPSDAGSEAYSDAHPRHKPSQEEDQSCGWHTNSNIQGLRELGRGNHDIQAVYRGRVRKRVGGLEQIQSK